MGIVEGGFCMGSGEVLQLVHMFSYVDLFSIIRSIQMVKWHTVMFLLCPLCAQKKNICYQ